MTEAKGSRKGDKTKVVKLREFWYGTLDGCPRQNLTLAGVTFPKMSEIVDHPDGALKTKRVEQRGIISMLTDRQVDDIEAAAKRKVVRSGGARAVILDKASDLYQLMEGDEPIGKFIFLISTEDASSELGPRWQQGDPTPLL